MMIRGHDVGLLLKRTWKEIGEDKIGVYAAQMAYAFFFSLFPLLLFFAALLNLVGDRATVQSWFSSRMAAALPADVSSLLGTTIQKVIFAKGAPGLLSFGLLVAAWSGSGVFGALRDALNDAYDVDETRSRWKQYALQLGMLVVAGVVVLLASVILLNGEGVMAWVGTHFGLGRVATLLWTIVQFPLAVAAMVALLWIVYMYLPNCRSQNGRIVLVGALVATTLWIAATLLFRIYVQRFNSLNPAYGAIGAIMLLLTWMYYSAFVVLGVGELTSELEASEARERKGVPRERVVSRDTAAMRTPAGRAPIAAAARATTGSALDRGLLSRLISALGLAAIAALAAKLVGRGDAGGSSARSGDGGKNRR